MDHADWRNHHIRVFLQEGMNAAFFKGMGAYPYYGTDSGALFEFMQKTWAGFVGSDSSRRRGLGFHVRGGLPKL